MRPSTRFPLSVVRPFLRILALAAAAVPALHAATFSVTTTANSGPGSLHQAILDANATPGADVIEFNIATVAKTISPPSTAALPTITESVTIDGTTQPGFTGVPLIELNGSSGPAGSSGFLLQTTQCVLRGLVINRWKRHGIEIQGGSNHIVEGCWIGISLAGTADQGNASSGIFIDGSPGNRIGGPATAQRNVISGNDDHGILLRGTASSATRIEGNYIGLNAAGAAFLRNSDHGIAIEEAPDTVIGGEAPGAGNVISGNNLHGIWLGPAPAGLGTGTAPANTRILGNVIGLNPGGTIDLGNNQDGIHLVAATATVIGGSTPAARNIISGNNGDGVEQAGGPSSVSGTVITGNIIGLNATGSAIVGNSRHGIAVSGGSGPQIGGTTAGAANIISGNSQQGIHLIRVDTAPAARIEGNRIGTDPDGALDLGNVQDGIRVEFASGVRIGGSTAGAGNLISGNNGSGIQLTGTQSAGWATGTLIEGNRIGTDATGSTALANNGSGIFINAQFNAPASGRIGGPSAGQANLIAFNGGDGVFISGVTAGNAVRGNSIHSNSQLGIDLGSNGITGNDATDADTGSNLQQNFPVLAEGILRAATTEIRGTLQTTANAVFTLDFYASDIADPTGNGEGQEWLGSADVTTDAAGFTPFTANVGATARRFISATATDVDGNTSEFSVTRRAVTTAAPADFAVTTVADSGPGSLRQAILDANTALNLGDRIVFNILGDGPHTIAPATALPALAAPITVDGYSQPGAAPNSLANGFNATLKIVLDGNAAPSSTDGLRLEAPSTTIRGLVFNRWKGDGIEILASAANSLIEGNVIGLGLDGSDLGQNSHGILVSGSPNNRIGGPAPAQRNVISGNNSHGILLNAARNNRVEGNFIGTDLTGTARVGNSQDGIHLTAGTGHQIGADVPGSGNVVGGNSGDGIELENTNANRLQGNHVGIHPDGTPIHNNSHGILISNSSDNLVGGITSGSANVIARNTNRGIAVVNNASQRNAFRGNSIFDNGNIGIDLANNGRTLNDPNDPDTGPNGFLNFPEIASSLAEPTQTRITGSFNSIANAPFSLDFFSTGEPDPTGFGEGQQFLGSTPINTGPDGSTTFDVTLPVRAAGRYITATATSDDGSTSEFSAVFRGEATLPPATFTVTSTADAGPGSLRQALLDADRILTGPPHRIVFAIPGDGPHVIQPLTQLPTPFHQPVEIDGFTQTGASPNNLPLADNAVHRIVLDGSLAPFGANGLRFTAPGNVVRGLVIVRFGASGIELASDNNRVEGCRIGLGLTGGAIPNSRGILANGASNQIGGINSAARNVIAGNHGANVELQGAIGAHQVQGNFIGILPSGTAAPAIGDGFFGSNVGVLVQSSPDNLIGGSVPGAGNVIGGHNGSGIELRGTPTTRTRILGNRIGSDPTGLLAVANGLDGIQVLSSGNAVGGPLPGEGNRIAFNAQNGVSIFGFPDPVGNAVRGNSIADNARLGINLGFDSVLVNDPDDSDSGPNLHQNFPVLTTAAATGASVTIEGSLTSQPNRTYTLDFYANSACDPSEHGEGAQYLGAATVTTGATGSADFNAALPAVVEGRFITATATDPDGNTSEFSPCLEASTAFASETFVVTSVADAGPGSFRAALLANNSSIAGEANRIEFNIPGPGPHFIQPASPLPSIGHAVVIDGFSQPGTQPNSSSTGLNTVLGIAVEFANGAGSTGLTVTGPDVTLRGLAVTGWFIGIDVTGDRAGITGCSIGLKPDGSASQNSIGIRLQLGSNHRIGGTAPADRNLISGNSTGLLVDAGDSARIQGNYFGLKADGESAPNSVNLIVSGANHLIGGIEPGAGNVISASGAAGVRLATANGCIIQGNLIGTDPTGSIARPNAQGGIDISLGSINALIGGSIPAAANVISGNNGPGILVAANAQVLGNLIGLAANGITPLGNTFGIDVAGSDAVIGGTQPGQGNRIAHNNGDGIRIRGTSSRANLIQGNSLFSNAGLGINLGFDQVTPNDPGDSDSGANDLQNHPLLTAANIDPTQIVLSATLNSTANTPFVIDFFASPPDPDSNPVQATQYLGSAPATTDGSGNALIQATLPVVASGRLITATSTGPGGTSELSPAFRAASTRPGSSFSVTTTADSGPGSLRQALLDAGAVLTGLPHQITFNIPGAGPHTLTPESPLPVPGEPVALDGFSQPGATPNTSADSDNALRLIRLDGSQIGFDGPLLRLSAPGSVVRGLILADNPVAGLELVAPGEITVIGCLVTGNANGIAILSSHDNVIGGVTPADRNRISGNSQGAGIQLTGDTSEGNQFLGNFIGLSADGISPAPNADGISILGGIKTRVGGTQPGEANRIAFNSGAGVHLTGGSGTVIRGNQIFDNGSLGIDLGGFRVTPNDSGDADVGPNGVQNFPLLATAAFVPGGARLAGTLDSTPNRSYTLDFYLSPACDITGNGQGAVHLGSTPVITDANGLVSFDFTLPITLGAGVVTATATDPDGNTSEFSPCRTVTTELPPQTFVVTHTGDDGAGSLRKAIADANAAFSTGPNIVTFNIPGAGLRLIRPTKPLPVITRPLVINGTSQPGSLLDTGVRSLRHTLPIHLDGALAGDDADGLIVAAPDVILRGLGITRFSRAGIFGRTGSSLRIESAFIGTTGSTDGDGSLPDRRNAQPAGVVGAGNDDLGIRFDGTDLTVTDSVIGNNGTPNSTLPSGIFSDPGPGIQPSTVIIENSFIGTAPNGEDSAPNQGGGIFSSRGSVTLRDAIIAANNGPGILHTGNSPSSFGFTPVVHLENSEILDNSGPGILRETGGVFGTSPELTIENSTISGNGSNAGRDGGIVMFPSSAESGPRVRVFNLTGNTISGNHGEGIHLVDVDNPVIVGNDITDNSRAAILLDRINDGRIGEDPQQRNPADQNRIKDNQGGGIFAFNIFRTLILFNRYGLNNLPVNYSFFAPSTPVPTYPGGPNLIINGNVPVFSPQPDGDAILQVFIPVPDDPSSIQPNGTFVAPPNPDGTVSFTVPVNAFPAHVALVDVKGDASSVIFVAPALASVDVVVEKVGPEIPVALGDVVEFHIRASATPPRLGGYNVVLRDVLPPGFEFVDARDNVMANNALFGVNVPPTFIHLPPGSGLPGTTPTQGAVEIRGAVGALNGATGSTTPFVNLDVTLRARANQVGDFSSQVSLIQTPGFTDSDLANNTAQAAGTVIDTGPPSDFSARVNELPFLPVGADIPFTIGIEIFNGGPAASPANFEIILPPGFTFDGPLPTGCLPERPAGGAAGEGVSILRCELDELIAGTVRQVELTLLALHPGRFPISIRVSPTSPDPDPDNNHIETVIEVTGPMDFGDAPDLPPLLPPFGFQPGGYPTLLDDDGASHVIHPGLLLGSLIDAEPDGQPGPFAVGDDGTGLADDDGVTFLTPYLPILLGVAVPQLPTAPGAPVGLQVEVQVPDPRPVFLNAWIDFNRNGDWDDVGEQIFFQRLVQPGLNVLNFQIPNTGADTGFSYARFRLSSINGVPPTGSAPDGEVEDYMVLLAPTIDFGDAPDIYGPAGHLMPPNPVAFLGALIDSEPAYQASPDARGDDFNDDDDEDGVTAISPLFAGVVSSLRISATQAGFVDLWIDYNGVNGFEPNPPAPQPSEYVNGAILGHTVGGPFPVIAGDNVIRFRVPDVLTSRLSYLRVRYTTAAIPNLGPVNVAPDGEVEDYRVQLHSLMPDFGDAPDSFETPRYPTLLANNGAFHLVTEENFLLGQRIDVEPDGTPSDLALGDDEDLGLSFPTSNNPDDEDGIRFLSNLNPGQPVTIEIVTSILTPNPAYIHAWIDFNRDFDWSDPGEQILANHPVIHGTNLVSVVVPANAVSGPTYARFRLSRSQGLGFTGPDSSGEVEDYRVEIATPATNLAIGSIATVDGSLELGWEGTAILEAAPAVNGPWTRVPGATSPFKTPITDAPTTFYRIVSP